MSDLIAKSHKPERSSTVDQTNSIILHHWDSCFPQRASNLGEIEPPVVVAKNCVDPERRFAFRPKLCPRFGRNRFCYKTMAGLVVAEKNNQIGLERIGFGDNPLDASGAHIGFARVRICDDGNRKR